MLFSMSHPRSLGHIVVVMMIMTMMISQVTTSDRVQQQKCQVTNKEFMEIMDTYDRGKPPNKDHMVLKVGVNVYLRELRVLPETLSIQVDLVLQQSWLDRRLSSLTELPTPPPSTVPTKDPLVSGADRTQGRLYTDRLEEGAWHCLWTPDTYISNARSVVAPDTPHPQRLVRLRYGGNVMYSTRLQAVVSCPALASHLKKFTCSIFLEPYGYSSDTVRLQWNANSFFVHKELTVPQYTLKEIQTTSCLHNSTTGSPSCLVAHLNFRSDLYFFASEIYGSSMLLVMISWLGFWMDGTANFSARLGLGLGVTALLILQGIGYRLINQKVGVPANIEVWLAFCVFLVLASLLELALAHVLLGAVPAKLAHVWYDEDAPERDRKERTDSNGVVEMDDKSLTEMGDESAHQRMMQNRRFADARAVDRTGKVLDIVCGLVFPIIFVIFNIIYWIVYH